MTPEERWTKIENVIQSLADKRGQHATDIAENHKQIAENSRQIAQINNHIEKNTDAIRDLIVVSRTAIEAQQQLREAQQQFHSEIKAELELLIKAVNAFVQGFRKPNGSQ